MPDQQITTYSSFKQAYKHERRALDAYPGLLLGSSYLRSPDIATPPAHDYLGAVVEFQGKVVKARTVKAGQQSPQRVAGKRGNVTTFSSYSRKRLLDLTNRLKTPRKAVFLTLTYPDVYPDAKRAKGHLRAFLERIRRRKDCAGVSAIWRMEFQERGAPHFHLVLFGLPFIRKEKIQSMWGEIIDYNKPFTRIEMIKSHAKLFRYVAKYLAKSDQSTAGDSGFNLPTYLHGVGRYWGIFQRDNLPLAELVTVEITDYKNDFLYFRRLAASHYPPLKEYLSPGFTLYTNDVELWLRTLLQITGGEMGSSHESKVQFYNKGECKKWHD